MRVEGIVPEKRWELKGQNREGKRDLRVNKITVYSIHILKYHKITNYSVRFYALKK
jgi:hypothetical protein